MDGDSPKTDDRFRLRKFFQRLMSADSGSIWLDLLQTLGPVLLLFAIIAFAALHFVRPAPPSALTIASGVPGSRFNLAAQKYQKVLARNGIKLNIAATEGSSDNLNRILAPRATVDIALVQSGLSEDRDIGDLISLGSVFYVPLTIFYRSPVSLDRLSQLAGQRIAIGPPGSGTRSLALALLKANEIEPQGRTQLLDLEGEAARGALLAHQVDAIFLTGDSAAPETIREMLHTPGIRLFDFPRLTATCAVFIT